MTDFRMFDTYRHENTHPNGNDEYCSVEELLRFWRENKAQYLTALFGDKLILERPIEYNRNEDELRRDMSDVIENNYEFVHVFANRLANYMLREDYEYGDSDAANVYRALTRGVRDAYTLCENRLMLGYNRTTDKEIMSFTIDFNDGRKVNVQRGMKLTRAISQICQCMDMSEDWERFRIAHSQVLNQKKLKGTLCLSIHPLDYATASDNDNGWSSCMSWREDGCYRMGTVEMMNSPMVICAYLKSNKQAMNIAGEEWNSKKWRAWIIVNKDVILCNRHYPYHQAEFAKQAIQWVRDLVGELYGWTYDEIHEDFYGYMRDVDCEIEFITNYMYNDLGGDDVIGCLNQNHHNPGQICFSGPAECMVCGKEIPYDVQGADQLECLDCRHELCCAHCGSELGEDDAYYGPDGEPMCYDCWCERYTNCVLCDETVDRDEVFEVAMPVYQSLYKEFKEKYPESRLIERLRYDHASTDVLSLCPDCARRWHVVEQPKHWDNSEEILMNEWIRIPDPNKNDMEELYHRFDPCLWNWHMRNITHEDRNIVHEFWTRNWELFKADFNKGKESA